jgi:hypothetical protein
MTAISAICQKLSKPSPFDLAHAMGYVIDNAGMGCDRPVFTLLAIALARIAHWS